METAMNNSGEFFRKFLLLWSDNLFSAIGSGLISFGLGVYAFEQTGKDHQHGWWKRNGITHYYRWGAVMCYFSNSVQLEIS
ncbi:hypothetical protein ACQKP0_03710 [Heyndrickxia sp. NPDC080065]|uniref:hypothetical protein n=1 Tax=Heyndrickxia sp. NPDC080065 TaxID=3390568 RepID=UPI003D082167